MQRHELIQNCALKKSHFIKIFFRNKKKMHRTKKKIRKETGSTTNKMRNAAKRKF